MTTIVELWSSEDQRSLEHFARAVEAGQTLDAVLALNASDLRPIDEAIEDGRDAVDAAREMAGLLGVASAIAGLIDRVWGIELEPGTELLDECDLLRCWETRRASPRTLALLWAYTARQLGLLSRWLEMNVFHPVVLFDGVDELLIDSTSGALVSKADCREIFREITNGEEHFLPEMFDDPSTRKVVADILELRLAGAATGGDEVQTYKCIRFHVAAHPDEPQLLLNAALAAAKVGDRLFATKTLKDLAVTTAGTPLEDAVRQALQRVESQFQYAN